MGDSARSSDDRLPWLDAPRQAKPTRAARRARTPLLVLLGLFFAGAIAVMAYLTGRGTEPVAPPAPVEAPVPPPTPPVTAPAAPVPSPAPLPQPLPATPVTPLAPAATIPAPSAAPTVRAAPAVPRATRPKATRNASARRSPERPAPRRPAREVVQPAIAPAPPAPNIYALPPPRTPWPARPFAGPRGQVVQLGAHLTQQKADAAWWRLARVYPYVTTLPRLMTWSGPSPGRPRYYRIRLAAGSNREARILCRNLVRTGRACAVV